MVNFFLTNIWQMMTFLNPLDALIPKIPFSIFADFWVWVTSEAWGSVSVGFLGVLSIEPFWGRGGGACQGALLDPPPSSMDSECASGCTWSTARATARLWDS